MSLILSGYAVCGSSARTTTSASLPGVIDPLIASSRDAYAPLSVLICVAEALQINTLNGAYASREEAIKGSITPGKLADVVVLADDPHTAYPDKIKDIQIVRTVVGGSTVYQA